MVQIDKNHEFLHIFIKNHHENLEEETECMKIVTHHCANGIKPHGGYLVQRKLINEEKKNANEMVKHLPSVTISNWSISDLELIGTGGFSPLEGFMDRGDYLSVLENNRLTSGLVWSLPITLPVTKEEAQRVNIGERVALKGMDGKVYGILELEEKYFYDKTVEANLVYGTTDPKHPGVAKLYEQGEVYLAGPIHLLNRPNYQDFERFYKDPQETRGLFKQLGWKSVVGFQTRNPIHRAHEYIQKVAMENVDGLLLHPLVGETKSDDIHASVRMKSYQVLLKKYYPKDRAQLAIYPAAMRYAGPREALLHALVRQNYGCTHFIIGRDHAGVGDYYGTYEAQEFVSQFQDEIDIKILKFEHAFYCRQCENMGTTKTCPHSQENHIHLSGTKVREMLRRNELPPKEFTRPEIAIILQEGIQSNHS